MSLSRRSFIGGAGAAAVAPLFGAGGGEIIRFGVISDIHLDFSPVRTTAYRKALEGFRAANVDAVLIPGDIAHTGLVDQLALARDVWEEVFPGSRRPDGGRVARLFLPGNHDWNKPKNRAAGSPAFMADDFAGNWSKTLDEPFEPVRKVMVKGCAFVLVDWYAVGGVEKWFAERKDEFDPSMPLVYAQHPHPKGTCHDADVAYWCADGGASTRALAGHPNAIAFSGHSHYPITDPYSIWQGGFTSLNCGSTWCSSRDYVPLDEKINGPAYAYDRKPELMPRLPVRDTVSPGMVVSVTDREVRVTRRDYLRGLPLGEDWVFPRNLSDGRPYSPSNRAKGRSAPRFKAGAVLCAERVTGEFDIVPPGGAVAVCRECVRQVKLVIPAAEPVGGDRVFGYEVKAFAGGRELFSRFLLDAGYHLPPSLPPAPAAFYIDESELTGLSGVRFEVRALERFGARSAALSCVS
ncbi:MAG: metallophosphoesterase [Kiritimatiellae bacterium]|nr:metallophosphoesterase [Kiritimatiellia bacterium]